jgi:V8-like Glu-specific endopeptidase
LLQVPERSRLTQIVANLYEFLEPRNRRVFIQESAGLGRLIPYLDLAGPPQTVASDLVGRLERLGELQERPTYHALGALLDAMLNVGDLADEQKAFVASLIVRYSLIGDTPYLQTLQQRYKITGAVVRTLAPASITPRQRTAEFTESPPFETQIKDEEALETVINSVGNFLDIHLLNGALYCARAVGRVEVPEGTARGTGFLIGPDLLLTNNHVLSNAGDLEEGVVRFGYYNDTSGVPEKGKVVKMKPGFFFTSPAVELDYSLVQLQEMPVRKTVSEKQLTKPMAELAQMGKHRGYLVLMPNKPPERSRVNIIQHPRGDPLKVVMTQNYVDSCTDTRLLYVADTMDGSSGSPVFNQKWEVVALHHSGAPYPSDTGNAVKRAWKGRFRVNEGILVRAILEDFKRRDLDKYLPRD